MDLFTTTNKRRENIKDYTHICIVLDASGSMAEIESDTKGSFNSFLKEQKEVEGRTVFDLYQFSDKPKRIVEHVDLATFNDDLMSKYRCSGCTALNDAVCTAIDTLGQEFAQMKEEDRPEHVMFVIITDGMENASRKFSSEDVKKRIQEQTEVYKWDFQYLAANQDAFATGEALGVSHDNCVSWHVSKAGIESAVCGKMSSFAKYVRSKK